MGLPWCRQQPWVDRTQSRLGSGSCPRPLRVSVGGSPSPQCCTGGAGPKFGELQDALPLGAQGPGQLVSQLWLRALQPSHWSPSLPREGPLTRGLLSPAVTGPLSAGACPAPPPPPPPPLVGITFPACRGWMPAPSWAARSPGSFEHTGLLGKLVLKSSPGDSEPQLASPGPQGPFLPEMDSSGPGEARRAPPQWLRSRSSPLQASRGGGGGGGEGGAARGGSIADAQGGLAGPQCPVGRPWVLLASQERT
uniref:Uncharacterized protein n=1 Tax=Myotis myotis TaxID=51298 RepID=A0A7J7TJJ6_MYOMY|nr:hypothetical protein mMyoMyo1_009034 [Myotis myotis]